jgi:aryl-alcohol dehydrogenase-like predicted oxidoreductase
MGDWRTDSLSMLLRPFGHSGLQVTELCLGTMTFGAQADEPTSFEILDRAWEAGIRFIDLADVYPVPMTFERYGVTEQIVGRWLRHRGVREQAVITSKAYFAAGPERHQRGNSRRHLLEACDGSLRRLATDRIDLYLCHGWDPSVAIEETIGAMEELRAAGKIRYAGLSNLRAHELAGTLLATQRLNVPGFAGVQTRYSLLYREIEESLLPLAAQAGLGVMVYNPLAGGMLAGKYQVGQEPNEGRFTLGDTGITYRKRYWNDATIRASTDAAEAARQAGWSPVTAAVAWALGRPDISSVIIGASRPDQLDANLQAANMKLPVDLVTTLDQIWFDLPRRPPTLDTPRLEGLVS